MKTKLHLTIIFLFVCIGYTFSQEYHPMLDHSSWIIYDQVSCCQPSVEKIIEEGTDEVIGSVTYQKFIDPFSNSTDNVVYLREDVAGKKVYKLVNGVEVLLYDFSLENSSIIYQNGKTFVSTVDEVGVNGGTRKRITLKSEELYCDKSVTQVWIEGVGSNKHPFYPDYNMYNTCSSGGGYTIFTKCSFQNGNHIFGNSQCSLPVVIVAPIAESQTFCSGAKVSNLVATGTNLKWYASSESETELLSTTALASGTYYVTQTIGTSESPRTAVAVTVPQPNSISSNAINNTISLGSSIVLTIDGKLTTGAKWKWEYDSDKGSPKKDKSIVVYTTTSKISFKPKKTTTYYLQSVGGICGVTPYVSITVNVIDKPTKAEINGPHTVEIGEKGSVFSIKGTKGYKYNWIVPAGSTITSGFATNSIKVSWGKVSGTVSVTKSIGNYFSETNSLKVTVNSSRLNSAKISEAQFDIVAFPNPYVRSFNLNISTLNNENIGIRIYDMVGKLVEEHKIISTSELSNQEFGGNLSPGIYNIQITLGTEIKALRMIKK